MTLLLLTATGLLLVTVVAYDAAATTVSPSSGGGPLTRALVRSSRRLVRHHPARRLLPAGTGLLIGTVVGWTLLLWLGWTLVLGAGEGSVASSTTGERAGATSRLYYAGFTVLTLGTGDYVPVGTWPQVATVLAAFTGLFLVTLSITYMLNVVSAVVDQRSLAAQVALLGDSGADVVRRWAGRPGGTDLLEAQCTGLAPRVVRLGQQHLAYPVLHRFADTAADRSAPVALAVLHDLLELRAGARPAGAPAPGEELLDRALDLYVRALVGEGGSGRRGPAGARSRREHLERVLALAGRDWPAGADGG